MELQVFNNGEMILEAVQIDGKVWFPATKTALALGYSNPNKAVLDHCSGAGVTIREVSYPSGSKALKFIDEANFYRLIMRSSMPNAEKVQNWVVEEVMPTIRKTGQYTINPMPVDPLDLMQMHIDNARAYNKRLAETNKKVEALEEKIDKKLESYVPAHEEEVVTAIHIRNENFPGLSEEVVRRLLNAVDHPTKAQKLVKDYNSFEPEMFLKKGLSAAIADIFDTIEFDKEVPTAYQFKSCLIESKFRVKKSSMLESKVVRDAWKDLIK